MEGKATLDVFITTKEEEEEEEEQTKRIGNNGFLKIQHCHRK